MAVADTRSPADRAYERFLALLEARALFTQGERTLSEADTRAKLIDPLFKTVLGWSEAEIRREEPVAKGTPTTSSAPNTATYWLRRSERSLAFNFQPQANHVGSSCLDRTFFRTGRCGTSSIKHRATRATLEYGSVSLATVRSS